MSSFCLPLQPVYPGRTRLVDPARSECRVVYGIVHPYELAQGVVLVRGRVPVTGLARYVAPAVVRVRKAERVRAAALGYAGDQGSGGVSTVRGIALYITVLGIVFDAVRYLPAGYPVKLVERVVHQVIVAPVVPQHLYSVVFVVLVLRLMRPAPRNFIAANDSHYCLSYRGIFFVSARQNVLPPYYKQLSHFLLTAAMHAHSLPDS